MEKPVRIIENEKIRGFNEKVKNGLIHALNFMMGADQDKVSIAPFEPFLMPIETYLSVYKKQSVLIKIHSDADFKGELYWFFELKTAIVLGAMMRMVPIQSVEEKVVKSDFDATDQDSFGEVGNQLSGILDRAFRTLTKKNIHLRMDFKKVIYPSDATSVDSFRREQEYVVLLSSITLPKYGIQKLTLLIPRSMYEVMLNLEITLEGITPKNLVVYSHDEAYLEKIQLELNSRHVKVMPVESPDEIINLVEKKKISAVGIHLPKMAFPLQHKDAILLKRFIANQNFIRTPYFLTWDGATEREVDEVKKLGLVSATDGGFKENFPAWAAAFTSIIA